MSIRPEWVAKILNGEKTIEIRKRFPIDYVGWVYIYCTKGKPNIAKSNETKTGLLDLNGKVVARFWCDKVEEICPRDYLSMSWHRTETLKHSQLLEKSCLTTTEIKDYLKGNGTAIHITKLEIFDRPKEISEFYKVGYENSVIATKKYILGSMNREERRRYKTELDLKINNEIAVIKDNYKLTRAPQSYQFIDI